MLLGHVGSQARSTLSRAVGRSQHWEGRKAGLGSLVAGSRGPPARSTHIFHDDGARGVPPALIGSD